MTISIPCPECGAVLRLRDESLFGKTGKCPRCQHRFELRPPEDEEVELEVAAPPPPGSKPPLGVDATWVPDAPESPAVAVSSAPVTGVDLTSADDPLRKLRRKRNKKWTLPQLVVLVVVLALLGGGGVWGYQSLVPSLQKNSTTAKTKTKKKVPAKDAVEQATGTDDVTPVAGDTPTVAGRPTKGEPISLLWMPSGARIVIQMHPSRLWKAGGLGEGEFVAALGPFKAWLEQSIQKLTMFEVAQIESLQVCLIPGARGTPPDIAAVVTLLNGAKKSDMLEKIGGERKEDAGHVYYETEQRAYVLMQAEEGLIKRFALCSTSMAGEMVRAAENPNPTDSGVEQLLYQTDRDLDLTIVCTPVDLKIHGEFLAPENAQSLLQQVADWLANDDEVEAFAWSIHLGDKDFYTELLARSASIAKPHLVAKSYKKRMEETPWQMYDTFLKYMHPPELGPRRLIGRLPRMTQVVMEGTGVDTGDRLVKLSYKGPERAGPNLAVATLLAWDESTRTNFSSKPAGSTPGSSAKVPEMLADRLKTKIEIDFRNMPLEDAFKYIAGEAGFEILVEGEELKLVGITKNETQNYQNPSISAAGAMLQIQSRPDKKATYGQMCFLFDESKKLITVTTVTKAEKLKQKPYELKP